MARWFNVLKSENIANGVQTLIVLTGSEDVDGGDSKLITIPIEFKKYELKTVRVLNNSNDNKIVVSLFDNFEEMEVYKSNEEKHVYDILNIPIEDKSDTINNGNVYLKIENVGSTNIACDYEIKILNLR